jgi:hypothetical protein
MAVGAVNVFRRFSRENVLGPFSCAAAVIAFLLGMRQCRDRVYRVGKRRQVF